MTFKTDKAVGLLLLEIFLFFLLQPSVTGNHTVIREGDPVQSSGELQKPEINLKDESYHGISIACVLPESVSDGSTCHLYTGDQPHPYKETLAIRMRSSSSTQVICIFEVSKSDLFRHLKVRRDVSCDYREDTHSLAVSPHSDGYNFTVQKPHFSSSRTEELFFFICEIPGPAGNDTICNLYVGNRKQHLLKTKIWRQKSSVSKLWFCRFTLTEDVLIRRLQSERSQEVSCDYRVSSGPNSLSPRSDGYMFTDLIASEPTTEQTSSTAGLTVLSTLTTNATRNSQTKGLTDSSTLTSDTRKSETESVSVSSTLTTGIPQRLASTESLDLVMGDMMSGGLVDSGDDGKDSVISSATPTFLPLGAIAENGPSTENENSDMYHTYCSIPDRPATSTQTEGLYSLLQIH